MHSLDDRPPAKLTEWVEDTVRGQVVAVQRVAAGGRRHGYAMEVKTADGRIAHLYLSHEPGEPVHEHGSTKLRREAAIFRRLKTADIPVPDVVAVHPTIEALLMNRVDGESRFSRLEDPAERLCVARHFMSCLAAVHRIDPSDPPLPGLPQPTRPRDHLLAFLDQWEAVYRAAPHGTDPVLELGIRWLRANAPDPDRRVALIQGDTGPGNFLYRDGRVTAILDWELAHLGDPLEDLGWLSMRAAQEPFPDLAARFREYAELSGVELDLPAIRYYRVLSEWTVAVIGHTKPRSGLGDSERGNALIYEQLHRRLMVEALAEAAGVELDEVTLPSHPDTRSTWLYDMALDQLRVSVVPRITDGLASRRAKGVARVVKVLRELDRLGPAAERFELDALARALGRRPADITQGRSLACAAIASGTLADADAIRLAWSQVSLANELLRPAMGRLADRYLAPLPAEGEVGAR